MTITIIFFKKCHLKLISSCGVYVFIYTFMLNIKKLTSFLRMFNKLFIHFSEWNEVERIWTVWAFFPLFFLSISCLEKQYMPPGYWNYLTLFSDSVRQINYQWFRFSMQNAQDKAEFKLSAKLFSDRFWYL